MAHILIACLVIGDRFWFKMRCPINFHHQIGISTIEIGNIATDGMLTAKFMTQLFPL